MQGVDASESLALASAWASAVPELEFEPAPSTKALLKILEVRRAAAVIVRADGCEQVGVGSAVEVSRRYPTTPLLVIGPTTVSSMGRPGPLVRVSADDQDAVLRFLREDVLNAARGSLSGVALPSVVQVLAIERRTCAMRVRSGRRQGSLVVRSGALVHAEFRKLAPLEAALEMLSWSNVDVVFEPAPLECPRTLEQPLDFLLLESARLQDERAQAVERKPGESILPSAMSASSWSLPALARGDADAMIDMLMQVPGALSVDLVDTANGALIGRKSLESEALSSIERVLSIARAVSEMTQDTDGRDWLDEIVVNLSSRFKILRPLRSAPTVIVCATFDRKVITLGMAKTMVAQVMDGFARDSVAARA